MPQMKGMKKLKLLVQQLRQSRYGREEDRRRGTGDWSNNIVPVRGHQYLSSHICFFAFIQGVINIYASIEHSFNRLQGIGGQCHPTFFVILSDAG
jgi:hypothetical protein